MKIRFILSIIVASLVCSVNGLLAETYDEHQFNLLSSIASEIDQVTQANFNRGGSIASLGDQNTRSRVAANAKSVKFHANTVSITFVGGFAFHVADYFGTYGNSRIVTCLDGDMIGHQGISDNGIRRIESTNVEWYNNYFIHYYPSGKVISYENSQIAEFYQ